MSSASFASLFIRSKSRFQPLETNFGGESGPPKSRLSLGRYLFDSVIAIL